MSGTFMSRTRVGFVLVPCVSRAVLILWVRTGGDSIQAAFVSMSRVIRTARSGAPRNRALSVAPRQPDRVGQHRPVR